MSAKPFNPVASNRDHGLELRENLQISAMACEGVSKDRTT